MSTISTIISKAETDLAFYKLLSTDFNKAIAPFQLSAEEITKLKTKLASIKPPLGANMSQKKR